MPPRSASSADPLTATKPAPAASEGRRPSLDEFIRLIETKTIIRLAPESQELVPAGGPADPVAPTLFGDVRNRAADDNLQRWSSTTKNSFWNGRSPTGEPAVCTTLSSIAKEANAAEEALRAAQMLGAEIPDILVDFTADRRTADLGQIGALQAPHRGYDALLRDSLLGNALFHASSIGRELTDAKATSATALLMLPHMLIFGAWHSQGVGGGSGTKIGRALKAEIIGYGAIPADIAASRIDPTGIRSSEELKIYKPRAESAGSPDLLSNGTRPNPGWETDPTFAEHDKGKPVLLTSKKREAGTTGGTAALVNHSNVKPSARSGRATITGAVHIMDLSLTALRSLSFPESPGMPATWERNRLAWTTLAALALVAMTHRLAAGYHLRSGCDLIARKAPRFEVVGTSLEDISELDIDADGARALLRDAVAALRAAKMPWGPPEHARTLKPTPQLIEAIVASKALPEDGETSA
ncbi:MAG: hypothetical protein INR62_08125 [Rhodospirillales bacterium]|nr:hypothetical protein [Acetobacter sp.]